VSQGAPGPTGEQIAAAVRATVRAEAGTVGRQLAEVRGLSGRAIRHLERIEADVRAERSARLDDLAAIVDLISAGWTSVDARLQRIEAALTAGTEARIESMDEHRADAA
jgi:hypothetical protein